MGIRKSLAAPPTTSDQLASHLLECGDRLRATDTIATSCCDINIGAGTEFVIVRRGELGVTVRIGALYRLDEVMDNKVTEYHNVLRECLADRYELVGVPVRDLPRISDSV